MPFSAILADLNEHFGTEFCDRRQGVHRAVGGQPGRRSGPGCQCPGQPAGDARLTFDHVVTDKLQDMIDSNFKFYKQITDDPEFARFLFDWLFDRYLGRKKTSRKEGSE